MSVRLDPVERQNTTADLIFEGWTGPTNTCFSLSVLFYFRLFLGSYPPPSFHVHDFFKYIFIRKKKKKIKETFESFQIFMP